MFYDKFKSLCDARGISCNRAALDMGLSNATPSKGKKNGATPDGKTLALVSSYFGVPVAYLLGTTDDPLDRSKTHWAEALFANSVSNIIPMPTMRKIPLVGSIACGTPILAEENCEGEVDVPDHVRADFALRCKGDSMINARIFDGDIVYIRQQESVEHGEIAAILIDDEATLKRVYMYDDCISLEAENPQYKPMVYRGEEMNNIRILGKAVAFTSMVQ